MPNDQDTSPDGVMPTSEMPEVEREPETGSPSGDIDTGTGMAEDSQSLDSAPDVEPATTGSSEALATADTSAPDVSAQADSPQPVSPFGAPIAQPTPGPQMQQPAKKSKKKWIIGGVIAVVIALLAGGGALAYMMYQNPDKVIMDGLANTLKLSGQSGSAVATVTYKDKDTSLTIAVNGQNDQKITTGTISLKAKNTPSGIDVEGTADFAADADNNGYIKLNNIDKVVAKLADSYIDAMAEQYEDSTGQKLSAAERAAGKKQMMQMVDPIIEKINNKWIKFAANDKDSEVSKEQKCVTDALSKLQSDKAMRDELVGFYAENKFIVIKEELGVKDGSYGYVLEYDKKKAETFSDKAKDSAFAKELDKCDSIDTDTDSDSGISSESSDDEVFKDTRFELWVSQWSHQITAVKFSAKNPDDTSASINVSITMDYAPVTGLELPKDAIDSKELEKELGTLIMGAMGGGTSGSTSVNAEYNGTTSNRI